MQELNCWLNVDVLWKKINLPRALIPLTFLILSLLLTGCSANPAIGPDIDDSKTGVKELTVTDNLPALLYTKRTFQGEITLQNKAGYNAENIQVGLLGLDRRYLTFETELQPAENLEGRSLYRKDGGIGKLTFSGEVNPLVPGETEKSLRYSILVRYSSTVEFSPTVCVDSGQYLIGTNCDYKDIRSASDRSRPETFSGQGAPVTFTNLEVVPYTGTNSEIELRMKLANRGRGSINSLRLGRTVLGSIPLDCQFRGKDVKRPDYVQFKEKKAFTSEDIQLICAGQLESRSAYQTALFVEVLYDYELTLGKSLEIKQ